MLWAVGEGGGTSDGEGQLEAPGRLPNGEEASTLVWKSDRLGRVPTRPPPLQATSTG